MRHRQTALKEKEMNKTVTEKEQLEINKFTRREIPREKLFSFSFILCDNEVDRDGEKFSDKALSEIAERFVGVTGIFDHDPTAKNQAGRIFETELCMDDEKVNSLGEKYKFVKAKAYMVLNQSTKDLAEEIDAGIKKEVSLCCSAERGVCSICGEEFCQHQKGETYEGKKCYKIIDEVLDAYEWSFVAIPAQISAGVIKGFSPETLAKNLKKSYTDGKSEEAEENLKALSLLAKIGKDYTEKLKQHAVSLLVFKKPDIELKLAKTFVSALGYEELLELEKEFEKSCVGANFNLKPKKEDKLFSEEKVNSFII